MSGPTDIHVHPPPRPSITAVSDDLGFTLGAMAGVLLVLIGLVALLTVLRQRADCPAEVTRKLLHIGMGLVALSFPWLFAASWPVVVLGCLAAGMLVTARLVRPFQPAGRILAVDRRTWGEVYYPLTVALLFALSAGDRLLFVIPLLILALADAVAALIGTTYGRLRYTTSEGRKSAEGSLAFFLVAFFSVHVPLLLLTDIGRAETLLLGVILGLLIMLMEAISWRGLDNLFIPLLAYGLLRLYADQPAGELAWRLAATVGLVVFVLAWRRRSTLDDSALIGAALFGYAAWMLGGWHWLIAPISVFVVYHLVWPGSATGQRHTVHAVLSITAAGLVCLLGRIQFPDVVWFIGYQTAFAAHLAIIAVSADAPLPSRAGGTLNAPTPPTPRRRFRRCLLWSAVSTLGVMSPGLLVVLPVTDQGIFAHSLVLALGFGFPATLLDAGAFAALIDRLYRPAPRPARIHLAGGVLATLAAAATMLALVGAVGWT